MKHVLRLSCALAIVVMTTIAWAAPECRPGCQAAPDEDECCMLDLMRKGDGEAVAGKYESAREHYDAAAVRKPHNQIALRLRALDAVELEKRDKLVEARAAFVEIFQAEPEVQTNAFPGVLAALDGVTPRLTVTLPGEPYDGPIFLVQGESREAIALGGQKQVNPGEHVFEPGTDAGFALDPPSIELKRGEKKQLALRRVEILAPIQDLQDEQAKEDFESGVAAFGQRNYQDAADAFQKSLRREAAAHTSFNQAVCLEKIGKLILARRLYAAMASSNLAAAEWVKAGAGKRVADIAGRLGKLILTLQPEDAEIAIDGQGLWGADDWQPSEGDPDEVFVPYVADSRRSRLDLPRLMVLVDPDREIEIVVSKQGFTAHREVITLASRERRELPVSLDSEPTSGADIASYTSLAVAAGSAIAAGVVLGLAYDAESSLEEICREERCPPGSLEQIDHGERLMVGFWVGCGLAAAGVVSAGLAQLFDDDGADAPVDVVAGPAMLGIQGRF